MKNLLSAAVVSAVLTAPVGAQQQFPPIPESRPAADSADVASVDAIIAALYESISGPAGAPRDWDRFRSLMHPRARLVPTFRPQGQPRHVALLWSVDEYIRGAGGGLETNGFFEVELSRTEVGFGNIRHAFSTYESRNTPDGPVIARGINSIQLLNDGRRWWIVHIMWDGERPDNPIPAEYLD